MEGKVDHYRVLGLASGEKGAQLTMEEISKAYKQKALELHPDKRPNDPTAHDNFLKLKSSFELLKDATGRKRFDELLLEEVRALRRQKQAAENNKRKVQEQFAGVGAAYNKTKFSEHKEEEVKTSRVDHYRVLGLPSGEKGAQLTVKEIRKAYMHKALKLHRDKRPNDPNVHDNFLKLESSYELLKDATRRKRFDELLLEEVRALRKVQEQFAGVGAAYKKTKLSEEVNACSGSWPGTTSSAGGPPIYNTIGLQACQNFVFEKLRKASELKKKQHHSTSFKAGE